MTTVVSSLCLTVTAKSLKVLDMTDPSCVLEDDLKLRYPHIIYKYQSYTGIAATVNLKWENTPKSIRLYHKLVNTGSSKYYGIVDWDGTLSGRSGPTLLGSAYNEWWKLDDNCVLESSWNMWACEKFAGREVGYLNVIVPGYIDDSTGGVSGPPTAQHAAYGVPREYSVELMFHSPLLSSSTGGHQW